MCVNKQNEICRTAFDENRVREKQITSALKLRRRTHSFCLKLGAIKLLCFTAQTWSVFKVLYFVTGGKSWRHFWGNRTLLIFQLIRARHSWSVISENPGFTWTAMANNSRLAVVARSVTTEFKSLEYHFTMRTKHQYKIWSLSHIKLVRLLDSIKWWNYHDFRTAFKRSLALSSFKNL